MNIWKVYGILLLALDGYTEVEKSLLTTLLEKATENEIKSSPLLCLSWCATFSAEKCSSILWELKSMKCSTISINYNTEKNGNGDIKFIWLPRNDTNKRLTVKANSVEADPFKCLSSAKTSMAPVTAINITFYNEKEHFPVYKQTDGFPTVFFDIFVLKTKDVTHISKVAFVSEAFFLCLNTSLTIVQGPIYCETANCEQKIMEFECNTETNHYEPKDDSKDKFRGLNFQRISLTLYGTECPTAMEITFFDDFEEICRESISCEIFSGKYLCSEELLCVTKQLPRDFSVVSIYGKSGLTKCIDFISIRDGERQYEGIFYNNDKDATDTKTITSPISIKNEFDCCEEYTVTMEKTSENVDINAILITYNKGTYRILHDVTANSGRLEVKVLVKGKCLEKYDIKYIYIGCTGEENWKMLEITISNGQWSNTYKSSEDDAYIFSNNDEKLVSGSDLVI